MIQKGQTGGYGSESAMEHCPQDRLVEREFFIGLSFLLTSRGIHSFFHDCFLEVGITNSFARLRMGLFSRAGDRFLCC